MEGDLAEQRASFTEGTDPRDWDDLPIPDGRMVIGLDGGYIRDWRDRKRNFELIVGRSMPEEGEARYIGFVHGYDRKPQRRIIDHLRRQGFQADQDLTFITDGGEEVRALAERISPCSEHVLDWFHITMRITVLRQFAQGLVHHDKEAGMAALDELRRIKWFLWHGNTYRAREAIDDLLLDLEALDSRYPNLRKFRTAMREFQVYIASNEASLINYGERYRSGERISSAFVEATVNAVISKRFAKKQQMQWSRRGAHLLLQTRTRALDGSLRAAFEHWYPGMMNDNHKDHRRSLPPTVIGIEACGGSHHWARVLQALGHEVKMLPPQFVKPYLKRGKNDAADAEAICEAMSRPTMRFVPVKSAEQQAALMLVGLRDRLIRQRTQLANAIRGYAAEFGLIAPKGIWPDRAVAGADQSRMTRCRLWRGSCLRCRPRNTPSCRSGWRRSKTS